MKDADKVPDKEAVIYVTKYAFTRGIIRCKARLVDVATLTLDPEQTGTLASVKFQYTTETYHRNEYHLTEEAARAHVEVMRAKRLKSLRNQIQKLERQAVGFVDESDRVFT